MTTISQTLPQPLNPAEPLPDTDVSYAEQSLALLVGAAEKFLDKAERVNNADLDRQDDDNPEPTPLGEESIRAQEALENATDLQRRMAAFPPQTQDAATEMADQVEALIKSAEDIGIKSPRPEDLADEDEDTDCSDCPP